MKPIHRLMRRTGTADLVDRLLALRALLFVGSRYTCPCCGWNLRTFTHGGTSLKPRVKGYCPRCNAKARHRWSWLFLKDHTELLQEPLRLLHIAPAYSMSRGLRKERMQMYVAGDVVAQVGTHVVFDAAHVPIQAQQFDAVICIHVLEHVTHDRAAIREIARVLKSGGWAVISVPIRPGAPTYEDPAITEPLARRAAFGEKTHVRWYGFDIEERLRDAGFVVETHRATDIDASTMDKYGLRDNEVIFFCTKP